VKKKLILLSASLAMLMVATALALAQTNEESSSSVRGSITNISGTEVLVEASPADESGSDKGYFDVSSETQIFLQRGGEVFPATFDDLQLGQLVVATYTGPILQSYPPRGAAGSITILEAPSGDDELGCLLPEGCDTDGDGVPDLVAGEPVPGEATSIDPDQ
jgi:Protein of unknown function (DUF3221)